MRGCKGFKRIVKLVIPPIFYFRLNNYQINGWFGNYSSWDEANKLCSGYDNNIILEKVKNSLLKIKNGEAVYERDSVLFDEIQYSYPLLSALLWVSIQSKNQLNLIDFGGSLGSTYYQNKLFLDGLNNLQWNIVEQSNFVECGIECFQDDHLRFYYSVEDCLNDFRRKDFESPNTILFSSVIQYIEKPYALLEEIVKCGFEYILFDRTAFCRVNNDIITIQKVPDDIYKASYPAWFFNEDKLKTFFANSNYKIINSFNSNDIGTERYYFKGFIFRKI